MTSTFSQQIEGLPPELVEQGWRRGPTMEIHAAWGDDAGHWWRESTLWKNPHIRIALPVRHTTSHGLSEIICQYDHAGWGEGLSPTPEMVKVWRWWWMRGLDGLQPVYVYVCDGEIVVDGLSSKYIDPTEWLGPVLPSGGTTI